MVHPRTIQRSMVLVFASLAMACGAQVVVEDGEPGTGGAAGEGGGDSGYECILSCGSPCTKCQGDACYRGWCSVDGICEPPEVPSACPR